MNGPRRVCLFTLGELTLCVDMGCVRSIVQAGEIEPVPLTGDSIRGVALFRGQVLSVLDLRRRLTGFESLGKKRLPMIVLRHGLNDLGLMVDGVVGVATTFSPPRADGQSVERSLAELLRGWTALESRSLPELDVGRLVDLEETESVSTATDSSVF